MTNDVRYVNATPTAVDFKGVSPPIVVDRVAGIAYVLKTGDVVAALGGGGGGIADPGANGVVIRTALNVTTARTITASTGITVTNGDGVAGNPTVALTVPVVVSSGGTGATSFTAGRILIGDGTSPITTDPDLTFDTATNKLTIGGDLQIGASAVIERGAQVLLRGSGTDNLFIGKPAGGGSITTAQGNVALGNIAMQNLVGGNYNAAIGNGVLRDATGAAYNVGIGDQALILTGTGSFNVSIGPSSGFRIDGNSNVAIGYFAIVGASSGAFFGNVAIGNSALSGVTTGAVTETTAIGYVAGDSITTGSYNTCIGSQSDVSSGAGTNRTAVGYLTVADTDNQVFFGNASVTAWVPGATNVADLGRSDRAFKILHLNGATVRAGTGSPEGAVTANVGSLFLRTDGGTGTVLYRKESGSGNTGWVATASGGAGTTLTTVDVDLGTIPRTDGQFNIAGAGLTIGNPVSIFHQAGPGTSYDDPDKVLVSGTVTSAVNIQANWSGGRVAAAGIHRFAYFVGA